jgi:hypothetical protein
MPANLKLDNSNLVPFIEILEQTVKQKIQHPNILIAVNDNSQMMSIVNDFIDGQCTKFSLENQNVNDLWSALIKIIHISDPILTAAHCDSLQDMNPATMSSADNPPENSNTLVTSRLPVYHQRLLGALFSAADMMVRLDVQSAQPVADSVAHVLIWNATPGSPSNRKAFCSLAHNCAENFPYYFTFANRIGLLVKPIASAEWMAILTEGSRGVIVGYSAALNPNYRHDISVDRDGTAIDRISSASPGHGLMQSVDLSATTGNGRVEVLEERPWNPQTAASALKAADPSLRDPFGGGNSLTARSSARLLKDDGLGGGGMGMGMGMGGGAGGGLFDKRANTPNLLGASSRDSSPAHPRSASFGDDNNPSNPSNPSNSNPSSNSRGIAMKPSSESLLYVPSASAGSSQRATEGRVTEESWDDSFDRDDDPPAQGKTKPLAPQTNKANQSPAQAPAPVQVRLKDLQNVFSSSLVSASSLEYRAMRNIDYSEDYADLK